MIISYHWLQSLLPKLTASPADVARALTLHSFETVVGRTIAPDPHLLTVRVQNVQPHPRADRLTVVTFTDGQRERRVVCGAPNVHEGDVVAYAPPGATVAGMKGERLPVRTVTIRGEPSPGMLLSPRELGLGAWHGGLFLLARDTPVGQPVTLLIPSDTLLEADITPNRAHDCLSMRGLAREVAALFDVPVDEPSLPPLPDAGRGEWSLAVGDDVPVRRYGGAWLPKVTVTASPLWLQRRLLAVGARPVNNVVDITNYVMYELGNPSHAFDAGRLPQHQKAPDFSPGMNGRRGAFGKGFRLRKKRRTLVGGGSPGRTVGVRRARSGETLTTLDGQTHTLADTMMVVTAADVPVALAGVMGGQGTEVTATTTSVWLEVANFDAASIAATARRLGISSEAAFRWSRGLAPTVAEDALRRCLGLLREHAGAEAGQVVEWYPHPYRAPTIPFHPGVVSRLAGTTVSPKETKEALITVRCQVTSSRPTWQVKPPPERLDLLQEPDLVEEVLRVVGYDRVVASPAPSPPPPSLPAAVAWREVVRDALAQAGFTETYHYSFVAPAVAAVWPSQERALALKNPVAPELAQLRCELLPGLLGAVKKNKGEMFSGQLFEIGHAYAAGPGSRVPGVRETERVAAVVWGVPQPDRVIANAATVILDTVGVGATADTMQPVTKVPWAAARQMVLGKAIVGTMGELDDRILHRLKLTGPVAALEFNLTQLIPHAGRPPVFVDRQPASDAQFRPYSKYPPVWRDLSVLVARDITPERVQSLIERVGATLVVDVDFFDRYTPSPDGTEDTKKQSFAFHVKYQSLSETLSEDQVQLVHNEIVAALKKEFGAELR